MRFLGAVAAALVIALSGAVVPATPAHASTRVLCVGYDACARGGYTNHGYKPKRDNLYWRMAGDHNCTNYVAYLLVKKGMANVRPWVGDGNAYAWGDFTEDYRDSVPVVGAVAWWDANRAPASSTGHVSYVEKVISKTEIIVSEDNWKGEFRWKRITKSGGGWPSSFIHFADSRTPKPEAYSATQVSQSVWTDKSKKTAVVSTALHPGATAWVELVYRNTGSKTWTGVSLATQQPAGRASELAAGWSSASKVVRHAESSVKPGSTATFGFAVKIPATATSGTSWVEHFAPRSTSGIWMMQSDALVIFGADSDIDFSTRPIPEITGTVTEGETLTAVAGAWDAAAALTYVWKRDGQSIPGAVAATYVPTASDVGRRLTVTVTARADGRHISLQTSSRTRFVTSLTSDTLAVGETLRAGEGRISANGVYLLTQRADGNLVIYDRRTMIPLWANAQAGETLSTRFSPTGALNTYTASGIKKWTSATSGSKAVRAVLRNDGHLVLYTKGNTKVWSSYTSGR
jgi:surface antigen